MDGKIFKIRPEFQSTAEEDALRYRVTNYNPNTNRCIIQVLDYPYPIAPTELVGAWMIEEIKEA